MRTIQHSLTQLATKPSKPDSAVESSASSIHQLDTNTISNLVPDSNQLASQLLNTRRSITPLQVNNNANGMSNNGMLALNEVGFAESNYEVFDPLNWMLDGLVDFPYSYSAINSLANSGLV